MQKLDKKDTAPSQDIRIDRDGIWYFRGAEMIRKDILDYFYRHLKRDEDGRYLIKEANDQYYLDVDDTPFVIKSVNCLPAGEMGEDIIYLVMPDDSVEILDPATLHVGKDNVLYCNIARLGAEARFSRASYYQIAEYVQHDPIESSYYFFLNGHRYPLEIMDI